MAAPVAALPPAPTPIPYQVLTDADFQSFVGNWQGNGPLCAALTGQADWDRYMHPAAVMGPHPPFGPAESFWRDHVMLLIARHAASRAAGDAGLRIEGVARRGGALTIATRLRQAPGGTLQLNRFAFVVLPRPLPASATFRDADGTACTVPRHG